MSEGVVIYLFVPETSPSAVPTMDGLPPEVAAAFTAITSERDRYKALYVSMLELCKKLEQGIVNFVIS